MPKKQSTKPYKPEGKVTDVLGPYHDKTAGNYLCRWKEDGKRKQFTRAKEDLVNGRLVDLRRLEGSKGIKLKKPPPFGNANYFNAMWGDALEKLVEACNTNDYPAQRSITNLINGSTKVSTAFVPYGAFTKLEDEIEKRNEDDASADKEALEEDVTDVSTTSSAIDQTLQGAKGSQNALHKPSGSVPD